MSKVTGILMLLQTIAQTVIAVVLVGWTAAFVWVVIRLQDALPEWMDRFTESLTQALSEGLQLGVPDVLDTGRRIIGG